MVVADDNSEGVSNGLSPNLGCSNEGRTLGDKFGSSLFWRIGVSLR